MNIYFTEEEKGDTTLLFLHGWDCDSTIFQNIVTNVNAHCVSIDLCGFGKSDSPPQEGYCVADYAEIVKDFIIERQYGSVVLVAHSFGARIAIVLAGKYPHLVNKLIITGGAGLRRFSLKRTIKQRWHKLKRWLVKCHLMSPKHIVNKGSTDYQNIQSIAMHNTFLKVIRQDLSWYAKIIKCPTLLVYGKKDKDTPIWIAKKLNRLIKDSELVLLEGGHFVFLQHPLQFANIINAMIKE